MSAKVEIEMRRSGRSFKEVVNDLFRSALRGRHERERRRPFHVEPRDLGLRPGLRYEFVGDVLEQVEGPPHR